MNPCSKIWVEAVDSEKERHYTFKLPCGSWRCPDCSVRNGARLRRLIVKSVQTWASIVQYTPAKFIYWGKMLTLTVPGQEWRESHTPAQAEAIMKVAWRKLRDRLKVKFGRFEFVFVDELQKNGYPHLHILLLGENIAGAGILDEIRSFWCQKMGMGNVDIKIVKDFKNSCLLSL